MSQFRWLSPLEGGQAAADVGAKAAQLSAALRAGFRVLPGWTLPVAASRPALRAGVAAIRAGSLAAGRRAVLRHRLEPALTRELEEAVARLGGRVIARSSSPLEADPRWSGAFSSVAEVGTADVAVAVRSCWAAALAPDPLRRLELCGLPLEAAALAVLLQPEIHPAAGGVACVNALPDGGAEVMIEGVAGHPGALLAGLEEGRAARLRGDAVDQADWDALAALIGAEPARAAARLALGVRRRLGDTVIEWAAWRGDVWLLQSGRPLPGSAAQEGDARSADSSRSPRRAPGGVRPDPGTWDLAAAPARAAAAPGDLLSRENTLVLAETVQARGRRITATAAAPGAAAGRLVFCRQHEPEPGHCRDAILLIDRPLPSYAPLLFAARGVIARAGAVGSHLAQVARSLGVPMVVGCRLDAVAAGDPAAREWLVAMDGGTGDVAVLESG